MYLQEGDVFCVKKIYEKNRETQELQYIYTVSDIGNIQCSQEETVIMCSQHSW